MTLWEIILDLYWYFTRTHAPQYQHERHNLSAIERWMETEYFSFTPVNNKKFTFRSK